MNLKKKIQADIDALPQNYKTADVDKLIRGYVRDRLNLSPLRDFVLSEQQFHRIYFHGSLKQIADADERLKWIDNNLLFAAWWHTDENIKFVRDADINLALKYAARYVSDTDPFVRRWGYVLFISKLCRNRDNLTDILALLRNDEHYYVQMAEAWLIAELTVFFPEDILAWLPCSSLKYNICGKATQKICESYRISSDYKERFKKLRDKMKTISFDTEKKRRATRDGQGVIS